MTDLMSSPVYSVNGFVKKMPALLTSASIDLKRYSAVSTILAAVASSPMWPSTSATWSEAVTSVDWVTFRELATTLKPRSTSPFTIPAPIPCEAPVTMAVFRWLPMIATSKTGGWFGLLDVRDAGVVRRSRTGSGPEELAIAFGDGNVVDAGLPPAHQAVVVEFPQLVAV